MTGQTVRRLERAAKRKIGPKAATIEILDGELVTDSAGLFKDGDALGALVAGEFDDVFALIEDTIYQDRWNPGLQRYEPRVHGGPFANDKTLQDRWETERQKPTVI